ncbi:Mut7-C RNAse domain-containing protein [Desulfococcus sp.]|uniref:Mut7-C RNAse domain-containing protein n=1 Tax=Desulfococcus sp. TaxID=2025834 RepID=UPI0035939652
MIRHTRFIVDPSLGKLCKWLRILGFDALQVREASSLKGLIPTEERQFLLTRITAVKGIPNGDRTIFIHANDPVGQLRQVIRQIGISITDIRPFSRCIRCNHATSARNKASALNRVPDHVWQTAERVDQCPECGRFYWRGSHSRRITDRIRQLFEYQDGS